MLAGQYVSESAKRGYYEIELDGRSVFVKRGYELVACEGEAHGNAFIDHCMLCVSGTWGWVAQRQPSSRVLRLLEEARDELMMELAMVGPEEVRTNTHLGRRSKLVDRIDRVLAAKKAERKMGRSA